MRLRRFLVFATFGLWRRVEARDAVKTLKRNVAESRDDRFSSSARRYREACDELERASEEALIASEKTMEVIARL